MKTSDSPRNWLFLAAALLLAFLLFTASYRFNNKYTASAPEENGSIVRISAADLSGRRPVFLAKGWEFYQYQLLTPDSFANAQPIPNARITIGQVQGFDLGHGSPHGSATYRQTLVLNTEAADKGLFLELPEIYGSYQLYINRQLAAAGDGHRTSVQKIRLPEDTRQVELLLAVSDDRHFYSGLTYPPALGTEDTLNLLWTARITYTAFTCCLALLAGVFLLVLGLKTRGLAGSLPFALLCLAYIGASSYPVVHMLSLGGDYWYSLEHLCYYLQFLLIMLVCGRLSGLSSRVQTPALALAGLVCAAVLVYPLWLNRFPLKSMAVFSLLIDVYKWGTVLYLAVLLIMRFREMRGVDIALGCGVAVFGASLVCDRLFPLYEPIVGGWMVETAVFLFLLILSGVLLNRSIDAHRRLYQLEEESRYTKLKLRLEEDRYAGLREHIAATSRLRHDLRQHYRLMQRSLEQGDYAQLSNYLEAYAGEIPDGPGGRYCAHQSADLIIGYYLEQAKAQGIHTHCRASLPEQLPFGDTDLCVLLGNALENALEASLLVKEPFLTLNISIQNTRFLVLRLSNRCLPDTAPSPGRSTKDGDHSGIGLSSISAIAAKYQGSAHCQVQDSVFTLSVILHADDAIG